VSDQFSPLTTPFPFERFPLRSTPAQFTRFSGPLRSTSHIKSTLRYFIDGHVTQELAWVMSAITTMAPNVVVKCNDAVGCEAKWHQTWIQSTVIRRLCPLVYSQIATKDFRKVFCGLFTSMLRHTAFLMRSTWITKYVNSVITLGGSILFFFEY